MEEDFIAGTMALDTTENGKRTKLKVLEHTHGWMGVSTEANGSTTTWMELASTLGKTAENMKENIKMIKSKVTESIPGQMDECTKATGGEVNSTDWVVIQCQVRRLSSVYGKRERE